MSDDTAIGMSATLISIALGTSLSGTTGVRAFLPLCILSVLNQQHPELFPLQTGMQWLGTPGMSGLTGFLAVVELIGNVVPGVDHALHAAMTVIHPFAGVAAACSPDYGRMAWVQYPMAFFGALASLAFHMLKLLVRLTSTASSGGFCNPCVSLLEEFSVVIITLLVLFFSIFAVIIALLVVAGLIKAVARKIQRRHEEGMLERPSLAVAVPVPPGGSAPSCPPAPFAPDACSVQANPVPMESSGSGFCTNCGQQAGTGNFCSHCGGQLMPPQTASFA